MKFLKNLVLICSMISIDIYNRSSISIAIRNLSPYPIVDGNFVWKTTHEGFTYTSNIKPMTPIPPGGINGWAWNDTWNYQSKEIGTYERTHTLTNASVVYEEKNPTTGQVVKKNSNNVSLDTYKGKHLDFLFLPSGELLLVRAYVNDNDPIFPEEYAILRWGEIQEMSNAGIIFKDGSILHYPLTELEKKVGFRPRIRDFTPRNPPHPYPDPIAEKEWQEDYKNAREVYEKRKSNMASGG